MLGSDIFCQGAVDGIAPWDGVDGGTFNVGSGRNNKFIVNSWEPGPSPDVDDTRTAGYTPFRLEGYIRVVEKTGGTGITAFDNRPDEEKGVLEISKFRELATKYGIGDRPLGELFNSVRTGKRLCFQTPVTTDTIGIEEITNSSDSLGLYFGSSIDAIPLSTSRQEKAFKISSSEGTQYVIPLAAAEIDYDLGLYSTFQAAIDNNYDINQFIENDACLKRNVSETPEYRMLFEISFPLKKMVSILGIYYN